MGLSDGIPQYAGFVAYKKEEKEITGGCDASF